MTDKIMEVYAQIYNWSVDSKGRPVPPYVMHPLPDFVMKRIKWVSDEAHRSPMSLFGSCMQVVDVDHEDRLKEQWEFGAASDYLPMSKEYKDWFNEPLVGSTRKIAACLAFLYYMDPEDQAKEKEEAVQNKEQVKKQKTCPFCRDDSVEKEWNLIETPGKSIPVTWINGNVLETENHGSTLGCPIKFCPMCGRRLESEDDDD